MAVRRKPRAVLWAAAAVLGVACTMTSPMASATAAGASAGATAATGTTAATASAATDPVLGGVFNNPIGTAAQQDAIITQMERLIDATPAGEEIDISEYQYGLQEITDHLDAAYDRGVHVKVITNTGGGAPFDALVAHIGNNDKAASYAVFCNDQFPSQTRGCISTRSYTYGSGLTTYAYNHNKFMLFSKVVLSTGAAWSDVVLQTSSNLGTWYENTTYNDSATFADPATYGGYKSYFTDLTSYRHSATGDDNYYRATPGGSQFRAWLFPHHENPGESFTDGTQTDTVVNILKGVSCHYIGSDGTYQQTDIRIVMWSFTRTAVADQLASLRRAGCWVDVVYDPDEIHSDTLAALTFTNGPKLTPCSFTVSGRDIRSHTKTMLISGGLQGLTGPAVFTGSQNYAISSLRQADETLLRIDDPSIYAQYLHNFYAINTPCGG